MVFAYYMAKETYYMAKETYYMAKETYYMAKETRPMPLLGLGSRLQGLWLMVCVCVHVCMLCVCVCMCVVSRVATSRRLKTVRKKRGAVDI
jgi:type IV secretory pathway VirB3-like protein